MRRVITIVLVLAVLGGGGYFLWQQRQAQSEAQVEILRRAPVERGPISATVNATGSIEPEALVSLTFGLAGTVQQVNASRGEMVSEGQVLAQLNTAELSLAVQQGQDALLIQQLTLRQRRNSAASAATLASAQADIDAALANVAVAEANQAAAEASRWQAQAQRSQLVAGPTAAALAAAEADIAASTAEMETIQDSYDDIIRAGLGGPVEEQTRFRLFAAQQAVAAAQAQLATLNAGPRPADIQAADAAIAAAAAQVRAAEGNVAMAQANVARAQAAYDRLLEPVSQDELAILEAQIAAAETNLALAQLHLDQSTIVAPIAGQVASVLINAGEQATPGAPAITLVNEEAFHIDVNVDEIDIDQLAVGQVVEITLDSLPETPVAGTVAEIAPTAAGGNGAGGVVTYLVTINIVAEQIPLRTGMTANAAIVVEEIENVLFVPNWAVRLDRESGEAFVLRQRADGTVEEVVVETGLRNEQFSEIISGLSQGDEVVVTNDRDAFDLFGGE